MRTAISGPAVAMLGANRHLFNFMLDSSYARGASASDACDFVFGNPHETPLRPFSQALQQWAEPRDNVWFAYKMNERSTQETIAASLHESHSLSFEPDDIFITNGAFAAMAVIFKAIVDPGDEVIFNTPPWFFYETLIVSNGSIPVRVPVRRDTFDLDLGAISRAITPRTRVIIVNSPHNPTGKIYSESTLQALASLLRQASEQHGRPIYLLSDEAYRRVIFDSHTFYSPARYYDNTFVVYTYAKTLLTPGQRLGYIALSPSMPDRNALRPALLVSQFALGYAFANALLQHAIGDLERMSIDFEHLQYKRDWLVGELRDAGYDLHSPEGTFYLLPRSPWSNDLAFTELLADQHVYCLPGVITEAPGYFRLSLTANDDMIEQAIPRFKAAIERARTTGTPAH